MSQQSKAPKAGRPTLRPAEWAISFTLAIAAVVSSVPPASAVVAEQPVSRTQTATAPAPDTPLTPDARPDPSVQDAVDLAMKLSLPLSREAKSNPLAYVNRGDVIRNDKTEASPEYKAARQTAIEAAEEAGNPFPPGVQRFQYANCSMFTATLILNTFDKMFPGNLTRTQIAYMKDPANGWVRVGSSDNYNPDDYAPGDIFLSRNPGHTFMWIGDYKGYSDVVTEAALAAKESPYLRLPSLKRYTVDTETGQDSMGRTYDVWRYVGRTGDAKAPSGDESNDYRNIFTNISATGMNMPKPKNDPYLLKPGSSSLAVNFDFTVPKNAAPGDEFVVEATPPYEFANFNQLKLVSSDGAMFATVERVSRSAVKFTLADAVATHSDVTGSALLTVVPVSEGTSKLVAQRLTFFGGETELGPNLLFDIAKWQAPSTGTSATSRIYGDLPGVEARATYNFDDSSTIEGKKISATFTSRTAGIHTLCNQSELYRLEWLTKGRQPLSSTKAAIYSCDSSSVTVILPKSTSIPNDASGLQFVAAWGADDPAALYQFTTQIEAPNLGTENEAQFKTVYRSAAFHGSAEGAFIPPVSSEDPQNTAQQEKSNSFWTSPMRVVYFAVLAVTLCVLIFFIGFRLGRRRK